MSIRLAILTGQEQRGTLTSSSEWTDIGIVIWISAIEAVYWRSVRIPGLSHLVRSGEGR